MPSPSAEEYLLAGGARMQALTEQESGTEQATKSKRHVEAGKLGQTAMLRGRLIERDKEILELKDQIIGGDVGMDVPWKHADLPSYLPKCPGGTCGKSNPNFPGLEKLAVCKNCKHPVGTPDDIKNDIVGGIKGGDCPWCGGHEAEMPEVKHD